MKSIRRSMIILPAFVTAFVLAAPAALALELGGAKVEETLTAGGKTLKRNGSAIRKKGGIVKVYVGSLYLEAASKDAGAIVAADAPKAIRMQFVRSVGKEKLVEAYREGFEANAKEKAAAQKASVEKFLSLVSDVKDGSVVTYLYLPGAGTVITVDGKDVETIPGKEFADALFLIWLGPKPPSDDLKKGLLG